MMIRLRLFFAVMSNSAVISYFIAIRNRFSYVLWWKRLSYGRLTSSYSRFAKTWYIDSKPSSSSWEPTLSICFFHSFICICICICIQNTSEQVENMSGTAMYSATKHGIAFFSAEIWLLVPGRSLLFYCVDWNTECIFFLYFFSLLFFYDG